MKKLKIPVFDINRQNRKIGKELQQAITEVIDSGVYILGGKVGEFEKKLAKFLGVKYAVGVASGTDAIRLALLSLGIKRNDEVIMPANCYPSVFGVLDSGAVPKFVDIDPQTYTINPDLIESAITGKTRVIMPVHLYGHTAEMEKIMEIGRKHKIPVVEDCAQAMGAQIRIKNQESPLRQGCKGQARIKNSKTWKEVGSVGDIGCFSFYPTKNLGAFGDGGMAVTDDEDIYRKLRLLRMYGEEGRYHSILPGKNSRLDEIQAAILLVKLKYLKGWNRKRRGIAKVYSQRLKNIPGLTVPKTYDKHIFHLYVIRSKKRDRLKKYLEENGIGSGIHYPMPVHLVPSLKFLGYKSGDFPESEKASREVLSLPMWPELEAEEAGYVADRIRDFHTKG